MENFNKINANGPSLLGGVSPNFLKKRAKQIEIAKKLAEHGKNHIYKGKSFTKAVEERISILQNMQAISDSIIVKEHIDALHNAACVIKDIEGLVFDCFEFDKDIEYEFDETDEELQALKKGRMLNTTA